MGVGCRRSSDPELLWPWRRLVATAPIRPLAWEPPYAMGAAQEIAKKKKDQKKKKINTGMRGETAYYGTLLVMVGVPSL